MSLIRDSLKKAQKKEEALDKTMVAATAEPKTGGGLKGSRSVYVLLGIGLLLIGAVSFLLFQTSPKGPAQPKLVGTGKEQPGGPLPATGTGPAPASSGTSPGTMEGKTVPPQGTPPTAAAKTEGVPGVRPPTLATIPPSRASAAGKDGEKETMPTGTGMSAKAVMEKEVAKGSVGEAASPEARKDKLPGRTEAKTASTASAPPVAGRGIETESRENLKKAYEQAYGWQQEGKTELAQTRYREILTQDPNNPYVLTNLGLLYQKTGRLREAVQSYEKAVEADPRFVPALQNLGVAWIRLGNTEEAGRWLERSLALDPGNAVALTNLGIIYNKKGNREMARQYWKKALSLEPRLPEVNYNLARLEEEAGNTPEAYRYYQQFIRLRNDPADRLVQEVQLHIRDWKLP
jgi:Flp pilus assembly protein TadD